MAMQIDFAVVVIAIWLCESETKKLRIRAADKIMRKSVNFVVHLLELRNVAK